jgi:hypothetical protein
MIASTQKSSCAALREPSQAAEKSGSERNSVSSLSLNRIMPGICSPLKEVM